MLFKTELQVFLLSLYNNPSTSGHCLLQLSTAYDEVKMFVGGSYYDGIPLSCISELAPQVCSTYRPSLISSNQPETVFNSALSSLKTLGIRIYVLVTVEPHGKQPSQTKYLVFAGLYLQAP